MHRTLRFPVLTAWLLAASAALAQPAPSFRATCAELRQKLATLPDDDGVLVTIQVVGALTRVAQDGALAYVGLCEAPIRR